MDNFGRSPFDQPGESREVASQGGYPQQPTGAEQRPGEQPAYPSADTPGQGTSPSGYPAAGGYPNPDQPVNPQPYYPAAYPPQPEQGGQPPFAPQPGYGQPGAPSQYGLPYGQPGYGQPGAPSQYGLPYGQPGYGQPGAPSQYGPYPGMPYGAPMPPGAGGQPPRRRIWPWIVGAVGAMIVLCLIVGGIVAMNVINQSTNTPGQNVDVSATATDIPTMTPAPTATLTAGPGKHMQLGHDYSSSSSDVQIINPTTTFNSGDQFAFVVHLPSGIGTTNAKLALAMVANDGTVTVLDSAPVKITNTNDNVFANKLPISTLMAGEPTGKYRLELEAGSKVVAYADFVYIS